MTKIIYGIIYNNTIKMSHNQKKIQKSIANKKEQIDAINLKKLEKKIEMEKINKNNIKPEKSVEEKKEKKVALNKSFNKFKKLNDKKFNSSLIDAFEYSEPNNSTNGSKNDDFM